MSPARMRLHALVGDEAHLHPMRVLESRREDVGPPLTPVDEAHVYVPEVVLGELTGESFEAHDRPRLSRAAAHARARTARSSRLCTLAAAPAAATRAPSPSGPGEAAVRNRIERLRDRLVAEYQGGFVRHLLDEPRRLESNMMVKGTSVPASVLHGMRRRGSHEGNDMTSDNPHRACHEARGDGTALCGFV
jgi:hypothetical protein